MRTTAPPLVLHKKELDLTSRPPPSGPERELELELEPFPLGSTQVARFIVMEVFTDSVQLLLNGGAFFYRSTFCRIEREIARCSKLLTTNSSNSKTFIEVEQTWTFWFHRLEKHR